MSNTNSILLCDSSPGLFDSAIQSDGAKESVMDHIITWTLKQAVITEENKSSLLYQYSRRVLCRLLGIDELSSSLYFSNVSTAMQVPIRGSKKKIDFICSATCIDGDTTKKYWLLSEDKYYGGINNDLLTYRHYFESMLPQNVISKCVLITKMHSSDNKIEKYKTTCKNFGFEVFSLDQLVDIESKDTSSDIFNEFWLRLWG